MRRTNLEILLQHANYKKKKKKKKRITPEGCVMKRYGLNQEILTSLNAFLDFSEGNLHNLHNQHKKAWISISPSNVDFHGIILCFTVNNVRKDFKVLPISYLRVKKDDALFFRSFPLSSCTCFSLYKTSLFSLSFSCRKNIFSIFMFLWLYFTVYIPIFSHSNF